MHAPQRVEAETREPHDHDADRDGPTRGETPPPFHERHHRDREIPQEEHVAQQAGKRRANRRGTGGEADDVEEDKDQASERRAVAAVGRRRLWCRHDRAPSTSAGWYAPRTRRWAKYQVSARAAGMRKSCGRVSPFHTTSLPRTNSTANRNAA